MARDVDVDITAIAVGELSDLFGRIALGGVQNHVCAQLLGCLESLLLGVHRNQKLGILQLCKLQVAQTDGTHACHNNDIVELDARSLDRVNRT